MSRATVWLGALRGSRNGIERAAHYRRWLRRPFVAERARVLRLTGEPVGFLRASAACSAARQPPDWANDQHTIAGRKLGRGLEPFRKEGVKLIPPSTGPNPYIEEAYRLWVLKQQRSK